MSLDYCASAIFEMADANTLLYFYCSYNLNEEDYIEYKDKYDGVIIINRKSLVEPDVYTKRIRKASGKKVLEERIRKKSVDLQNLLANGDKLFAFELEKMCAKIRLTHCFLYANMSINKWHRG